MPTNIFTYGTLMFEPVWQKVTGIPVKNEQATVYGFERKSVKGQVYPVMIPSGEYQKLVGVIYFDIDKYTLKKLDIFEGPAYRRLEIEAATNKGQIIKAYTYVIRKEYFYIIGNAKWDPQQFEKEDMHCLLEQLL